LSNRLSSLVEAANDPYLNVYVVANLGQGVPNHTCFKGALDKLRHRFTTSLYIAISRPRQQLIQKMVQEQVGEQVRELQERILLELQERQLTREIFEQSELLLLTRKLPRQTPEELRRLLRDMNPVVRYLTIQAITRRRLPLEEDLVRCLQDDNPTVREASHLALITICRGTDLGPRTGSPLLVARKASERWREWLALQATARREMDGTTTVVVAPAKPPVRPPLDRPALKGIAKSIKGDPRLEDTVTAALLKELTEAKAEEQSRIIERLQSGKGVAYSDALAVAIPRLQGDLREQARQALARRLARMKAGTLRDKMQEDDAEVRLAAARACLIKAAVENTEDLIGLLDDSEPAVVQAAHEALRKLTPVDHGPAPGATARQRRDAVRAWRDWLRRRDHPDR
jgi:hypothetical protein